MVKGISACIIGKDEEKNLDKCLKSIADIVDEIIYLDTGSNDKSIKIAKDYNAIIYESKFENDFSKVRNKSISYAKYEWILILDCDEELCVDSKLNLINTLEIKNAEGIIINIINMVDGKPNDKFQSARVFKNRKEYFFQGKIHEQIASAIVSKSGIESLIACNIDILHHGYDYDKETEIKKYKRNLEILESIEEENRDEYYYYNLGNEYARVNDYKKAILNYEISVKLRKTRDMYTVFLYERLAHFYYLTGKFQRCIDSSDEGIALYKTHMYFYYVKGLAYIEQMKFTKALDSLLKAKFLFEENLKDKNFIPMGLGIYNKDKMYEGIRELQECVIGSYKNMITTIIDCRNSRFMVGENIKSVNEISDEIVIITDDEDISYLKNELAFREVKGEKKLSVKEIVDDIKETINTRYILLLNNDEGLTLEDEERISKEILKNSPSYTYLFNIKKNRNEIRLVDKSHIKILSKIGIGKRSSIDISYFS